MERIHFTFVHVEDEASHWRALPRALRNALYDKLDGASRATLVRHPPEPRGSYPAMSRIFWVTQGIEYEINYWLLESASVTEISKHIRGQSTFIIDVMRPGQQGILQSSLSTSLRSIEPFVSDWDSQVRVFTAFNIPNSEKIGDHPLNLIRKSDTGEIVEFLIRKVLTI